jgi:hypothetical protein
LPSFDLPESRRPYPALIKDIVFRWEHRRPVRDLSRPDQPIIEPGPILSAGEKSLDLVPNAGLNWISSQMAGVTSGKCAVICVGSGTATPTMGDLTLQSEITGCLAKSTRIFVNEEGLKQIADIEPGDMVYTLNERYMRLEKHPVIAKKFTGIRKVFKVRAAGREILATDNHPFLVLDGRQLVWKPLSSLKVGDAIAIVKELPDDGHKRPLKGKVGKLDYTNEDLMWLLGVYVGDGHSRIRGKSGGEVCWSVPESDPIHDEVCRVLMQLGYNPKKSRGWIAVYRYELAKFIMEEGFAGNVYTKRIPEWIFTLPRSQITAFLAGLIDSDGHVDKHGHAVLTSVNKQLLESAKLLAIKVGWNVEGVYATQGTFQPIKGGLSWCRTRYDLRFGKGCDIPSRNPKHLERLNKPWKFRRLYKSLDDRYIPQAYLTPFIGFTRIKEIEPMGEEEVYDIEVEKAHNFVAEGFMVHNSGLTRTTGSVSGVGALAELAPATATYQGTGAFWVFKTFTASGTITVNEAGLGQDVIYNAGIICRDVLSPGASMAPGDQLYVEFKVIL